MKKTRLLCVLCTITVIVACDSTQAIEDYRSARTIFWERLYPGGHTLYCHKKFTSFWHEGINVEHVFPMSWVKNALSCGSRDQCRKSSKLFNRIEADLHNLYPAISHLNYERQSYRFGIIPGEKRRYGQQCDFEVDKRMRVVEPREAVRGDVARAMLYMERRYKQQGLKLFKKQAALLLKWHYQDPPDKEEQRRNTMIEKLQGNRNPFIDNPSLSR
ncbi:MAG: endonuclease I family protein [Arenicella sp.]